MKCSTQSYQARAGRRTVFCDEAAAGKQARRDRLSLPIAGCQVMSLVNSDENKTFGVVLRTPVENSKGIPHILEHSVLCGSRKYPIKVRSRMPCRNEARGQEGLGVHGAA